MEGSLFSLRDARPDDLSVMNAYAFAEGMDGLPSVERVRVAVNEDDDVVGFIRIVLDRAGRAHVNPVVTHETWRGFGVGRALMEDALAAYGELRLVSRGASYAFYQALGFEPIGWESIKPELVAECEACELRDECGPKPCRLKERRV